MRFFWKLYWFFIAIKAFGAIGFIGVALYLGEPILTPYLYMLIVLDFIAVAGLYGYVWEVAYLNYKVWLPFSIIYILANVLQATGIINIIEIDIKNSIDIFGLVSLVFYLPKYYALILYSNKKHKAWQRISA